MIQEEKFSDNLIQNRLLPVIFDYCLLPLALFLLFILPLPPTFSHNFPIPIV